MFTDCLKPRKNKVVFAKISPSYMKLTPVEKVIDGRVCRTSEFKKFDIKKDLEQFKAVDFSIASLKSVGADAKLSLVYMSKLSDMTFVDNFEKSYTTFIENQSKKE